MIIVDASIATKWLVTQSEPHQTEAIYLLSQHLDKLNLIHVPELIFYEVANVLATKTSIPSPTAIRSVNKLYQLSLNIYHSTQEDVSQATKLAKKYRTSVYDMLYAVTAKKHQTILVTADTKFIQKTGFKFVKHIADISTS